LFQERFQAAKHVSFKYQYSLLKQNYNFSTPSLLHLRRPQKQNPVHFRHIGSQEKLPCT